MVKMAAFLIADCIVRVLDSSFRNTLGTFMFMYKVSRGFWRRRAYSVATSPGGTFARSLSRLCVFSLSLSHFSLSFSSEYKHPVVKFF